jgi:hypothetical protein
MSDYAEFLDRKTQSGNEYGFSPTSLPSFLFDVQHFLVDWALRKGRAGLFADCGFGKTPMQLVWGDQIVRRENKPVLLLTPLAVSAQTIVEAAKFGIEAKRSSDGAVFNGIVVTNYERLHYFNWQDFAGVICDESSILKSFDGSRRIEITEFMRKVPYRLLCTATAAPNDYIELGTSSEALGELGAMDMMNRFFKNDSNNSDVGRSYGEVVKWRFKGHAEIPFWKWVCSWARAIRKPSDFGFDDGQFILPQLIEKEHLIETVRPAPGMLFTRPALTLPEQREERRRTLPERCDKVAELVARHDHSLIWCHLNAEGDYLAKTIPNSVQVSGSDSDEQKEEVFTGFARGQIQRLITKPKIGAWGLNFQVCNHVTTFPSHSYEQYYQGVRRCWRFGQKRPVTVDIVTTEGDRPVMENARRKSVQADRMFSELVAWMNQAMSINRTNSFTEKECVPSWL